MGKLPMCERRGNGVVVLAVSGELDVATGRQLDDRLAALAVAGLCQVVLDTVDLTFCDASGITILIRSRNRVVEQQGWLRLARASPALRRLLGIVGLTQALPVFDTVADAIDGMRPGSESPGIPAVARLKGDRPATAAQRHRIYTEPGSRAGS
jgi:anti-anti-sigma factor